MDHLNYTPLDPDHFQHPRHDLKMVILYSIMFILLVGMGFGIIVVYQYYTDSRLKENLTQISNSPISTSSQPNKEKMNEPAPETNINDNLIAKSTSNCPVTFMTPPDSNEAIWKISDVDADFLGLKKLSRVEYQPGKTGTFTNEVSRIDVYCGKNTKKLTSEEFVKVVETELKTNYPDVNTISPTSKQMWGRNVYAFSLDGPSGIYVFVDGANLFIVQNDDASQKNDIEVQKSQIFENLIFGSL